MTFLLLHSGGMQSAMDHPAWDRSWATPSEQTIDDLGELGLLRVEPSANRQRKFTLSMKGRQAATQLMQDIQGRPQAAAASIAPPINETLAWLVAVAENDPSCLAIPSRLLDRAMNEGLIADLGGRERLAEQLVSLHHDSYVQGALVEALGFDSQRVVDQSGPWQLSMRAYEALARQQAAQTPEAPVAPAPHGARSPGATPVEVRDVFISHASEDKEKIARPLALSLQQRGFSVWFDSFELTLGDQLSASIDEGLASSRFGVVVLSEAFFAKPWPQRELAGLVARQMAGGEKTILPVWHGVDHARVTQFSPSLGDQLAVDTSAGLSEVVSQVVAAIERRHRQEGLLGHELPAAQLATEVAAGHTHATQPESTLRAVLQALIDRDSRLSITLEFDDLAELVEVSGREVDDALLEAVGADLVEGQRSPGDGSIAWWSQLRLTVAGLRSLGQWPPASQGGRPGPWTQGTWGRSAEPLLRRLHEDPPADRFYLRGGLGDPDPGPQLEWQTALLLVEAGLLSGSVSEEGIDELRITRAGLAALSPRPSEPLVIAEEKLDAGAPVDAIITAVERVLVPKLEQLGARHDVPVIEQADRPVRAARLNDRLRAAGTYGKADHAQVDAWLKLRNDIAHGADADAFGPGRLRAVIIGIGAFVEAHA